jgi:hypothetical protein
MVNTTTPNPIASTLPSMPVTNHAFFLGQSTMSYDICLNPSTYIRLVKSTVVGGRPRSRPTIKWYSSSVRPITSHIPRLGSIDDRRVNVPCEHGGYPNLLCRKRWTPDIPTTFPMSFCETLIPQTSSRSRLATLALSRSNAKKAENPEDFYQRSRHHSGTDHSML